MRQMLWSLFFMLFWQVSVLAKEALDQLYSFQRVVAVVVNTNREPVHGEHVESVLIEYINSEMRYGWDTKAYQFLKKAVQKIENPSLGGFGRERLNSYQELFPELEKMGINALVLCEVRPKSRQSPVLGSSDKAAEAIRVDEISGSESYEIHQVLIVPGTGEIVQSLVLPVENSMSLDSFAQTSNEGIVKLFKAIPFDATLLSREGYRVVVDAGFPRLRVGMELPVFTMDRMPDGISFTETGIVLLTQVERNLAFGRILVERKPLEVSAGNKFRFQQSAVYLGRMNLDLGDKKRELASVQSFPSVQKGNLGNLGFSLGASLVNHSITASDASGGVSSTYLYPGGNLKSELWVTRRIFFDLGFQFSTAVLSTSGSGQVESLNSSLTGFNGQVGYRLNFFPEPFGPMVYGKLGLAAHRFVIDRAVDPLFFGNISYRGLSFGAGADLPVTDKLGLGVEINVLLFPSLDEGDQTSGAQTTHVSGYDMAVRTYYNLSPDLDVEGKLLFNHYGAQFSGAGTRARSLASSSWSSKAVQVGVSYYF